MHWKGNMNMNKLQKRIFSMIPPTHTRFLTPAHCAIQLDVDLA